MIEMEEEEIDDLIQKILENDDKTALAKLIGYLIELDKEIQDRLEKLKKLMADRSPAPQPKFGYIA